MSLRLYFDHNFPGSVLRALRRRGVDVVTSVEDGTNRWADERLLDPAKQLDRLLVTMDIAFFKPAAACQVAGREFAGVVFVTQGKMSIGEVIDELQLIAQASAIDDYTNRVEWLPL